MHCGRLALCILLVFVAGAIPLGLIIGAVSNANPIPTLEQYVLGFYLMLFIIFLVLGVVLLYDDPNEGSISGMIAQRYRKTSYLVILATALIAGYTSCFIIAGAVARERLEKSNYTGRVIMASFSPLLVSLILVFPVVVQKTANELACTPQPLPPLADPLTPGTYQIEFFPLEANFGFPREHSVCFHRVLHYASVGGGVLLGDIAVGLYLNTTHRTSADARYVEGLEIGLLATSAAFCFIFLVLRCFKSVLGGWYNHLRLWFEFFGLYLYLVDLIFVSMVAGDLIQAFP